MGLAEVIPGGQDWGGGDGVGVGVGAEPSFVWLKRIFAVCY